jgi:SAM-dependent methyltransferase
MHPRVYQEFERILTERPVRGSVLEIGAMSSDASLLCMKPLAQASTKVGLDLDGPHEYKDFKILKGNSNSMDCFEDNTFDAVLSSSTLEHDKYFWKTLAEIKRVTKPGGLIVIGVPGYGKLRAEKIKGLWARMPLVRRLQVHQYLNALFTSTITFQIHNWPGDYYRFGPQAIREVFLEGLEQTEVRSIMLPPRHIGVGVKPLSN